MEIPQLIPAEPQEVFKPREIERNPKRKVPVTIVTGFLGSGKTTLVTRLLNDNTHGKRIAVILNEFGESAGIDKSLTRTDDGTILEEWLELGNGCLCCSVKDAGVKAIENLIEQRGKFDYVVLETTGLADPAPIASIFWLDEQLQSSIYLDGIVTVVDAKYVRQQVAEQKSHGKINECLQQIAMADRIVVNKKHLVTKEDLDEINGLVKRVNATTPVFETNYSEYDYVRINKRVPVEFYLDLHAFDAQDKRLDTLPVASSHLDADMATVAFAFEESVDPSKVDKWIQDLLWEQTVDGERIPETVVLRLKGVLHEKENPLKIVVQGVRELYDKLEGQPWGPLEERLTRIVLIGKNLNQKRLRESFRRNCIQH